MPNDATAKPAGPLPIDARLALLEVEVRKMRRLAMGGLLIVGLFLGSVATRLGEVAGKRWTLKDGEGKARLALDVGEAGEIKYVVTDAVGAVAATGTLHVKDGQVEARKD